MFINIHTHRRTGKKNQLEIVDGEDTVGIHPWNIDKVMDFRSVNELICMVGETGLDRSNKYKENIELQKKILKIHFTAATFFNLPIVIHCVHAHSDLLQILHEINFKGKILLHDYRGNLIQTNSYLKFDTYFSIRSQNNFIPLERMFLETDDQTLRSIEEIYQEIGLAEEIFEKNFLTFFSNTQKVCSSDVIDYLRMSLLSN